MEIKNSEGYTDFTAFAAIKAIDGAEQKAYYTIKTMQSVARLAGFRIQSEIILQDRNGTQHKGTELLKRREGNTGLFKAD